MSGTDAGGELTLLVLAGPDSQRLARSIARHNAAGLPVEELAAPRERPGVAAATLRYAHSCRTRAYLPLPADAVFVRDFTAADLVGPAGIAGLTEDRERRAAGVPQASAAAVQAVRERLGLKGSRMLVPGGPMPLPVDAVRGLVAAHGDERRLADEVPDAALWCAGWLQAAQGDRLVWREPAFLLLGGRGLPVDFSQRSLSEGDVARGFVGYVGELPDRTAESVLAGSVPAAELLRAAAAASVARTPRVMAAARRLVGR